MKLVSNNALTEALGLDKTPEETETPVRAEIDKNGLHIKDPEIIKKFSKLKVSNSLISGMQKCPCRQAADKWILPDILPVDPLGANVLGSAYHKVMEIFYGYPPRERTLDNIKRAFREMLDEPEFYEVSQSDDAKKWVKHKISEYWKMHMEDPTKVHIAQVERETPWGRKELKSGLELYVQDKIGDSSRPTCGFIDRLSVNEDGDYVVDDWKTGKHAKPYDPKEKYADFSYVRQQIIYSMILEQTTDKKVAEARLIYPDTEHPDATGKTVDGGYVMDIDIRNPKYRERTVKEIEECSELIDQCVGDDGTDDTGRGSNLWAVNPGPLCSWCPLVNICPSAFKYDKPNAVAAREKAPSREMLEKGGIIQA